MLWLFLFLFLHRFSLLELSLTQFSYVYCGMPRLISYSAPRFRCRPQACRSALERSQTRVSEWAFRAFWDRNRLAMVMCCFRNFFNANIQVARLPKKPVHKFWTYKEACYRMLFPTTYRITATKVGLRIFC